MLNFKDAFKSIADKAQEKITEIKDNETIKQLIEQGKESIDKLQSTNPNNFEHQKSSGSQGTSSINVGINLKSNSSNCQVGEHRWTPSLGQGLSYIFVSKAGIRCVSGSYGLTQNKIALSFQDITLSSIQEKETNTIFSFVSFDGKETTLSISCIKKANQQELVQSIVNYVHAVAPQIEVVKQKYSEASNTLEHILNYLQNNSDKIIFQQLASYRGGISGFPTSADKPGKAYVFNDVIVFHDNNIGWITPYNRVIKVELDFFQLRGSRAFLASPNLGRMLQEVKNTIAVTYLDDEDIEQVIKFQIHGAATIPGEGVKAQEFLNYLLQFKKSFLKEEVISSANLDDPLTVLKKLKELKDQGIISDSEFEAKKQSILKRL
jgi:hypothetical protein